MASLQNPCHLQSNMAAISARAAVATPTLRTTAPPAAFARDEVRNLLKAETVRVDIDLRSGTETATAWGCDLSKRYVEINTEYN